MNRNQSSVLYQNRHCSQEKDGVVFKLTFNGSTFPDFSLSFLKVKKSTLLQPENIQTVSNDSLFIKAGICDYLSSKGVVSKSPIHDFLETCELNNICVFMKELYMFAGFSLRCCKYDFTAMK